jgi:hypothetical protein
VWWVVVVGLGVRARGRNIAGKQEEEEEEDGMMTANIRDRQQPRDMDHVAQRSYMGHAGGVDPLRHGDSGQHFFMIRKSSEVKHYCRQSAQSVHHRRRCGSWYACA